MATSMGPDFASGDPGDQRTGLTISQITFGVGLLGTVCCMIFLQWLLLKLYRFQRILTKETTASPAEICIGITIFWAVKTVLDRILYDFIPVSYRILSAIGLVAERDLTVYPYGFGYVDAKVAVWNGISLLFSRVLTTWQIHLLLVVGIEIFIPFLQDPARIQNIVRRTRNFLIIIQLILDPEKSASVTESQESPIQEGLGKSKVQIVRLERSQAEYPNERRRMLSWNLVIDKDALDEIKETLGPPGGFGELGFCVAKDGIKFEAMGVETSFSLKCVEVENNDEIINDVVRKRR